MTIYQLARELDRLFAGRAIITLVGCEIAVETDVSFMQQDVQGWLQFLAKVGKLCV